MVTVWSWVLKDLALEDASPTVAASMRLHWWMQKVVARYVQVQDASTPRTYFLRVPPTAQTAAKAVAWTFSRTIEEYHPERES